MRELRLRLALFLLRKEVQDMAVVYATLIIKGRKTIDQVPAVGYLYKKYKQADARQKAVELGVQALLRDRIVQSYYHYEERGWITLHGLENVNAMYKEYHALGGNGTVTALVNTIHELEVRDDKRPASQA